jgi:hypothetical protein
MNKIIFENRKKLCRIIKKRKTNRIYSLKFVKKYSAFIKFLLECTTLPKSIICVIIMEYINDVFFVKVMLQIVSCGHNYGDRDDLISYTKYDCIMTIESNNININFDVYNFKYLCNFSYEKGDHNHRNCGRCANFYVYIEKKILTYERHILHNFDKTKNVQKHYYIDNNDNNEFAPDYSRHALDDLNILFSDNNMQKITHNYTYYNEKNTVIYTINNPRMFRELISIIELLTENINDILIRNYSEIISDP